jgi:S1-C subfamily serine protease
MNGNGYDAWLRSGRPALLWVLLWFLLAPSLSAQDAVPNEILARTFFIKAGSEAGTAFTVDHQGRIYLVTARHVVAELPTTGATLQVWQKGQWADYKTIRTLFPKSSDVDIAVLETEEKASKPYEITSDDASGGPTFGQQVWFLGYPYGISSHFSNGTIIPFIKRGTMSAVDASDPDAVVIYLDAFNNPGFSGGPILYWSFSSQKYKLLGVVKGYRNDTAKMVVNGTQVDTNLLVNSGILVGYSIEYVIKAIERGEKQP